MAKFMRRGTAKVSWLPAVAAAATTGVPTAAEITAGTALEARIADMAGWSMTSSRIDTPDLGTRFTSNIPGERTVADSTFTFYADDANTDPIKTAMPVDQTGFIYIRHSGVGTGKPADLFPVRVMSIGNEYTVGNDAARFVMGFAVTSEPKLDTAQA